MTATHYNLSIINPNERNSNHTKTYKKSKSPSRSIQQDGFQCCRFWLERKIKTVRHHNIMFYDPEIVWLVNIGFDSISKKENTGTITTN